MNKFAKRSLECLAVLLITFIIVLSSPFNPWKEVTMTAVQTDILNIAHQIREGFLAYVEVDGNYGPVLYEFYGLGYLPTDGHIVHLIMESVLLFVTVLFLYKTAKLYTSEIFALVCAAGITIFKWGMLTHAGAEEMMFFILSLTGYHIARQLKYGFLSHHSYLLAIDLGLVFFLQPGYVFFWVALIIFFAIKFKLDGVQGKKYRAFYISTLEGLATVAIPMGLYLWYFKNAEAFWRKVVGYNMNNLGGVLEGLKIIWATPWIILVVVLVVVIVVKLIDGEKISDLCCWLGIMIVAFFVIAMQGDNYESFRELSKALYIVPAASAFSLIDKPLGLTVEERKF